MEQKVGRLEEESEVQLKTFQALDKKNRQKKQQMREMVGEMEEQQRRLGQAEGEIQEMSRGNERMREEQRREQHSVLVEAEQSTQLMMKQQNKGHKEMKRKIAELEEEREG